MFYAMLRTLLKNPNSRFLLNQNGKKAKKWV